MKNELSDVSGAAGAHNGRVNEHTLNRVFRDARTHNFFTDRPVTDETLAEAVQLAGFGPTAFNTLPLRLIFIRSAEAKERLRPTLSPGNVDKTMIAPVTAVIAFDSDFAEHMPRLFPYMDVKAFFAGMPDLVRPTAEKNSTLQAAYFILALRALGLDAGPMVGFNPAALDAEFFPDGRFKSSILINIGYGDHSKLNPRAPRFAPEEISTFL